jgi:hypothetical protein
VGGYDGLSHVPTYIGGEENAARIVKETDTINAYLGSYLVGIVGGWNWLRITPSGGI